MEITQTYGYRLSYSQQEFTNTITATIPENAPREAVRAENILLGVKLRLEVLSSVYEYGEMDEEEFQEHLENGFIELLKRSKREMDKLNGKDGKHGKNEEGEPVYENYRDYVSDLVYVKKEIDRYLKQLAEED